MTSSSPNCRVSSAIVYTLVALVAPAIASAADIDMLVIGDSITVGDVFDPGFRQELFDLLDAETEHSFTWLGSSGSAPVQGHFQGGKEIEDFYPFDFGDFGGGKFDVTPSMGPPVPDLVAIHLGTNDLNSQPPPYAPYSFDHGQTLQPAQSGNLAEFITYLIQWQDGTFSTNLDHIVLSMIVPMQGRDQDVADFNEAIIAMSEDFAEGTVTGTPVRITLADHYNHFLSNPDLFTFGPGDWMNDGLHPNVAGYDEMASIYHPAVFETVDDATTPATINDFFAASFDSISATLSFTAPGDDGMSGTASRYDLRVDTNTIDAASFALSKQASGEPFPLPGGMTDTIEVTGLLPGTTYHFAIKASDNGGNRSDISNVVTVQTTGTPTIVLTLRDGLDGYFGTEDASVFDIRPDDNLGSGETLSIGQHGGSAAAAVTDIQRSLVRFDLSAIPSTATITGARLELFNHVAESPSVDVGVYRVTKAWVEGTETSPQPQNGATAWAWARFGDLEWSNAGVDAASDGASNNDPDFDRFSTAEDIITLDDNNEWYAWDVTDAVAQWVAGTWQNDGLLVRSILDEPDNRRRFHSSEGTTDQSLRPTLVVTFTTDDGTAVAEGPNPAPIAARLIRAFPNPFRSQTAIEYELSDPGNVSLGVFDVLGRQVRLLVDANQFAGRHASDWDGRSDRGERVPAGVYFYRLSGPGVSTTHKIVVAR